MTATSAGTADMDGALLSEQGSTPVLPAQAARMDPESSSPPLQLRHSVASKESLSDLECPYPLGATSLVSSVSPSALEDLALAQSPEPDSASSVPLHSKLVAQLRSIDGPVNVHLAAGQGTLLHANDLRLGDKGKVGRSLSPSTQRREGVGRGGSISSSK